MKKKSSREINCIRVNLNIKHKYENPKKINNITYVKIKENYDSYYKRNQNSKISKDNSTLNKLTIKGNLESNKNNIKDENISISLKPFIHKKKMIYRKKEEIKKNQRNVISMRRFKYSMKVKNAVNIKKIKNFKYDVNHVITIQKWVKGFLLRSFLFNASEVEKLIIEFVAHINKFIYIKFNFLKKLKSYNFVNIKNINDNFIENKKYFSYINENISISNINTNNNTTFTNTFTNNNTFSAGQETPEIFENNNRNRELLINQKRNNKAPSIRDLLMKNSELDKTKSLNYTQNKTNKNSFNIIKFQKAKSLNNIKKDDNINMLNTNDKISYNYKSIQPFFNAKPKLKEKEEINHKIGKVTNLRTLLFNNINNNNEEKIYKKPIAQLSYITKDYIYNKKNIINYSPKSEKIFLPKIYQISPEENEIDDNNANLNERNENPAFGFVKIIIDEIKEAKEDEEDDSQSPIMRRINPSFYEFSSKKNFSESQISDIYINDKNKNYNYNIDSSSFQINPCLYDKKKILIVLLLEKQILFGLKPYIFNLLKNYWKNKIFS